jgi:hypothetical protein
MIDDDDDLVVLQWSTRVRREGDEDGKTVSSRALRHPRVASDRVRDEFYDV